MAALCAVGALAVMVKSSTVPGAVTTIVVACVYYAYVPVNFVPLGRVRLDIFFLGNILTFLFLGLAWNAFFRESKHLAEFLQPVLTIMTAKYLRMGRHESGASS